MHKTQETRVRSLGWEDALEKEKATHSSILDFSLSCIGEGNGNPLQCSCLENPRDGGTRWAAWTKAMSLAAFAF